ncbi:MAG: class I tRNA ligase family protein, partial [Acidimicrobiia bacterium]
MSAFPGARGVPEDSMPKAYDPAPVEARWYQAWEEAGAFRPEMNPEGEPFCIVIPPPNVTGSLHMGHAFEHSLIDATVRRKRMQGFAALWLPGTDHAGIATQNVVERELAKEGLDRHEIGRDAFVERVWRWKETSGGQITAQMRKMGASCDWSRERFTMDEGCSRAVRVVFVRLYEEGLVYRANRIINWCPRCHTALSDIEVEHDETEGELVYIRYPFKEDDGFITVATTRAETMLGDTAVAVHPADPRYAGAVGRTLVLPLVGREIPVVADDAVDPDFGTGAVKVTPAHDPN